MIDDYNPMFRHLEKYVGTYRVLAHYDLNKNDFPRNSKGELDETFDDLYIPCARGIILHTYTVGKMCWYIVGIGKGRNAVKDIDKTYKGKVEYKAEETSDEVLIYFDEKDMKKICALAKPRTAGKNIKPYSRANLPTTKYEIPEEDLKKYTDLLVDMDKTTKMHFSKAVIKGFDAIIQKKKGKRFKIAEDRDISGLSSKEYIHSLGMWEEFIKYAKKELKGKN